MDHLFLLQKPDLTIINKKKKKKLLSCRFCRPGRSQSENERKQKKKKKKKRINTCILPESRKSCGSR